MFRWWDIVDILLVALLIDQLLVRIRGTRSAQMLLGLSILFAMFVISDQLSIRTVRAVLGSVFENWVIILLLLFQNDIRRSLSQIAQGPWFRTTALQRNAQWVEELIKACGSLSNKKIGALMVIEREADVLDFVESGTVIDSVMSKEVLTSLFLPVSPLHDGAVVLRKERIYMAGCFLPLTMNPNASKTIGTRHRAAIGLSEETDALCIVISEENGQIALASQGKLTHDLDPLELRQRLLEAN